MSDLVGHTLGQYELLEEIGHGGMANVYSAVQRSIGRKVAVKVLPAHFLQDRSFLERFSREVQVVARLHHPHILQVYDYGEQDGVPYIVMGYLEGGSLADLIRRSEGGLALGEVVPLVRQIAGALDYAHRKGIIHRDFKPSNVLLDTEGNAYLSDFGIAKVTEYTAQLTGSGYVGTPAYMAPEMTGQAELTPLVDIYALGATLYEMLTGQHPYSAQTPMGVLMAHVSQPVPDVRERRPDLPPAVQGVIERAMAKDPLNRYQTAGVLADDLEMALLGQQSAETAFAAEQTLIEHAPETEVGTLLDARPLPPVETMSAEETPPPIEARPKRRGVLPIALGGLAAVVILALGLFVFWPRGEEPGGVAAAPTEVEEVSFPTATIPSSEEGTSVPTEESFSPTEQPATPTLTPIRFS
jgi:serine/threonine protein kinase